MEKEILEHKGKISKDLADQKAEDEYKIFKQKQLENYESDFDKITKLGDGTAIKIMDGSVICDYRMVEYMKGVASKNNIKHQMEILTAGGTDTGAIQRMAKNGAICGAVSIPTRHIHQTIETCHKGDIQLSIDLLALCIEGLDKFDWSFK